MTMHTVLFKVGIREEIIKNKKNERKKEMPKTKTTRQIVAVLCISFCPEPGEDGRPLLKTKTTRQIVAVLGISFCPDSRQDGKPLCADSDHFSECFIFTEVKSKILFLKNKIKIKKQRRNQTK